MRYFAKFVLFTLFLIYAINCSIDTSCGRPGHSRKGIPINAGGHEVFAEGYIVEYSCGNFTAFMVDRMCKGGKWSGSIPKCPKVLNVTGLSAEAVKPTRVVFTWKGEMRVVGLEFAVQRPSNQSVWPKIAVRGITGIGPYFGVRMAVADDEDILLVRVFAASPDVRFLDRRDELAVVTNNHLANCAANDEGSFSQLGTRIEGPYLCIVEGSCKLYGIDETIDDCQTPDTPLNAFVESTFKSEEAMHANYSCAHGYRLKMNLKQESPICPENGDWTSYDFQPCEKIMCDRDGTDFVIVSFDQPATSGSKFPIGTKGFLSCSTLQDKRHVVCAENGAWVPKTKLCATLLFRSDALVIGLMIGVLLLTVLTPVILCWLYRRARLVPTALDMRMKHLDASSGKNVRYIEPLYPDYEYTQNGSADYDYIDYDHPETTLDPGYLELDDITEQDLSTN
ncbi:hypothetical protein HDE_10879 [Halotydeus destructor]|nr:hypothetical protein HDE_10879 [Halotydeus destructor]